MNYSHFTLVERKELSALLKKGYSLRFIAGALGKAPSSVSRELKDNTTSGRYEPLKAQAKTNRKRLHSKHRGMKIRSILGLEAYIIEKLQRSWTPEQIAQRLKSDHQGRTIITHKAIYQWLYSPFGQAYTRLLPSKRYEPKHREKKKTKREIIRDRIFIDHRPSVVNRRETFGHVEADTLGAPKSSKQRIAAIEERLSRKLFAVKVKGLKYAMDGFKQLLNPYSGIFLSWTLDNGVENASYQRISLPAYFCHPYSSWEKGSLENSLGRLRRFIPKQAKMEQFSQQEVQRFIELMNDTPRKCLNWKTPNEVFKEQLANIKH